MLLYYNILNLQIQMISQPSSLMFFSLYLASPHQKLQLSSGTFSFTKLKIAHTNVWYWVSNNPILYRVILILITQYTVDDIINVLEFLVDKIFVVFEEGFSNR